MKNRKTRRIIDTAKREVTDFKLMFERLEQKVLLRRLSIPPYSTTGDVLPRLAYMLSAFLHYRLRYLFRIYDLEDRIIKLPSLKKENKLEKILGKKRIECKSMPFL